MESIVAVVGRYFPFRFFAGGTQTLENRVETTPQVDSSHLPGLSLYQNWRMQQAGRYLVDLLKFEGYVDEGRWDEAVNFAGSVQTLPTEAKAFALEVQKTNGELSEEMKDSYWNARMKKIDGFKGIMPKEFDALFEVSKYIATKAFDHARYMGQQGKIPETVVEALVKRYQVDLSA